MLTLERQLRFDQASAAAFASVYEPSFPPSEREETGALIASIEAGERLCYVARRDGSVIGIAVVLALDGPPAAFLEYLAVSPAERGAGAGGQLLDHVAAQLRADAPGSLLLVFEVEPPETVDGPERELRERRIAFYLRHRASIVECAPRFRAPNLEHESETEPYVLLSVPLEDGAPPQLDGSLLRDCVRAILTQSYELAADDPLVQEVLDELAC